MAEKKTKNIIDKILTDFKLDVVMSAIKKRLALISIVLVVISVSSLLLAFHFWNQSNTLEIVDSPTRGQEEAKNLIAEISKLVILPDNEEPIIATVSNPDKLKDQPFFSEVKKGDKVLIYTRAKRAILYDPISHKLINIAPLNVGDIQKTPTPTPTPTP